jgi:outer membrane receptor protein involved in Fe transport
MTRRLTTAGLRALNAGRKRGRHALRYAPLASAISAILAGGMPMAHAATETEAGGLEEIVVTAQKKSENLQDVPISISVFDAQALEQLHINGIDDYVKYSPSVSYVRSQGQGSNGQPGDSHIYMRGVVSGGDGNHSGSQPSVGTYLDEQPVTTIDGTPEIHIYDMARIEVLEGPQGTLFGASSEAGTIRLISNKADPTKFAAGYDVSGSAVQHGGLGYSVEGFVNIPLTSIAAVRLVGWDVKDAGYIDNVAGTSLNAGIVNGVRTFPTWNAANGGTGAIGAGSISNAAYVKNNYNTVETKGGRVALQVNLNDSWTVTPTVMGQTMSTEGFFGYDPAIGPLKVTHFGPESSDDSWVQSALTVEGKVANFDIVYAGAYMKRTQHSIADYADYGYFYDAKTTYASGWVGNDGKPIMPQQIVIANNAFEKWSNELRVTTPQEYPVKATAGVFVQRQQHNISQDYLMPGYGFTSLAGGNPNGFASALSVPGHDNTIWLTDETRVDRDRAVFAQLTWDITSQWALSGGLRYYKYDNTLEGYYGYSAAYSPHGSGQEQCGTPPTPPTTVGAPCTNLDNRVAAKGHVPRVNLTYKITPEAMVYATWSKGFRPGGVNRTEAPGVGPYQADFLTNYEIGWKTEWFGHHLRWNGAVFDEEWKNFQFSFLGPSSVTIIENAGNARIRGIENEIQWAATDALSINTSFTFLDPRLTQNYCGEADPATGQPATTNPCPAGLASPVPYTPQAPGGTNLPVVPKFKGNVVARYSLPEVREWKPYAQAAFVYQNGTAPQLRVADAADFGRVPAYGLLDLSGGIERNGTAIQLVITNATDKLAQLTRFEACTAAICTEPYAIPAQPRTFTIKFGQKF